MPPALSATPLPTGPADAAAHAPAWRAPLSLLLESTGVGIHGIDPHARCTRIHRAAAEMPGGRTERVLGRHMHDLKRPICGDGEPCLEAEDSSSAASAAAAWRQARW